MAMRALANFGIVSVGSVLAVSPAKPHSVTHNNLNLKRTTGKILQGGTTSGPVLEDVDSIIRDYFERYEKEAPAQQSALRVARSAVGGACLDNKCVDFSSNCGANGIFLGQSCTSCTSTECNLEGCQNGFIHKGKCYPSTIFGFGIKKDADSYYKCEAADSIVGCTMCNNVVADAASPGIFYERPNGIRFCVEETFYFLSLAFFQNYLNFPLVQTKFQQWDLDFNSCF